MMETDRTTLSWFFVTKLHLNSSQQTMRHAYIQVVRERFELFVSTNLPLIVKLRYATGESLLEQYNKHYKSTTRISTTRIIDVL